MRLPTCERCGKFILPDEPALHRNGRPAQHRHHYQQGYTAQQRGRWSKLLAEAGLVELDYVPLEVMPKRGRKPSMSETESMQYQREERRRRARK